MADVQTPVEVAPAKIEEVVDEVVVNEETTTEAKVEEVAVSEETTTEAKVEEVVDEVVVAEEKQEEATPVTVEIVDNKPEENVEEIKEDKVEMNEEKLAELANKMAANMDMPKKAAKQGRGEKKARKELAKLGLKLVSGVNRVTIRKSKNILFVINNPDVYKNPATDSYVVIGEAKIEDLAQQQKFQAAAEMQRKQQEAKVIKPEANPLRPEDEEDEDENEEIEGADKVDEKDIELVMQQASVSRQKATKALVNCDFDVVNAIMKLTI